MGFRRIATDLKEVQTNLSELLSENTAEEKAASLRLADSATRFSQRTRAVVDDKLSFSATLMRAGEVNAATRLLREVEEQVRTEEAALIEVVNEAKVAGSIRRQRITRLRLARTLIAALLGAGLLATSAIGMAVAGVFRESQEELALAPYDGGPRAKARSERVPLTGGVAGMRRLRTADLNLLVTESQFRKIIKLTGGSVSDHSIDALILMLPDALALKIQEAIDVAESTVASTQETITSEPAPEVDVEAIRREAAKKAEETADDAEEAADETEADAGTQDEPQKSDDEPADDGDGSDREKDGDDPGSNESPLAGNAPPISP